MDFKHTELTDEEYGSCANEEGILDMDLLGRLMHKKDLESGLTNIKSYTEWRGLVDTLSRPWM